MGTWRLGIGRTKYHCQYLPKFKTVKGNFIQKFAASFFLDCTGGESNKSFNVSSRECQLDNRATNLCNCEISKRLIE